jgi:hypothetical protein
MVTKQVLEHWNFIAANGKAQHATQSVLIFFVWRFGWWWWWWWWGFFFIFSLFPSCSQWVPTMFPTFPICSPRMFPIVPHFFTWTVDSRLSMQVLGAGDLFQRAGTLYLQIESFIIGSLYSLIFWVVSLSNWFIAIKKKN